MPAGTTALPDPAVDKAHSATHLSSAIPPVAAAASTASTTGHCFGSALGPQWIVDVERASGPSTATAGSTSSDTGTSPGPVRAGVRLVTGADVIALRGCGSAGAVACLASGAWLPVGEASDTGGGGGVGAGGVAPLAAGTPSVPPWPLMVRLSTGLEFGCDLVVRDRAVGDWVSYPVPVMRFAFVLMKCVGAFRACAGVCDWRRAGLKCCR